MPRGDRQAERGDDANLQMLKELRNISQALSDGGAATDAKLPMAPTVADPKNAIIVANNAWQDDRVLDVNFSGDLQPGETEVVARVESTASAGYDVYPRAVATTGHGADIDGDGNRESIIRYKFEIKSNQGDSWNALQGLETTMPFGSLGEPVELLPGTFIGPVAAFRITFVNRSDQFSNPTAVDADDIGAEIHARIRR
jgi:hypothetical protein